VVLVEGYMRARVLTATALISFPRATPTICPTNWAPGHQTSYWESGSRCFFVPPERSSSLFRCVDLCKEHGGTPACIGSAEENGNVTAELAAADGIMWLGLYQNNTGLGPAKGWDRCVAGDAPSFSNWHESQPDAELDGHQEDCAFLDAYGLFSAKPKAGKWYDVACDTSYYPAWWLAEFSCLCARGNASDAFAADRGALEATRAYNQRLLTRRTSIAFAAATAIAILPTLMLLGRAGWRRLCRGSVEGQGAEASPSLSATAAALSTSSGAASSAAGVKGKLHAARASAAGRRLRVSFAMGQVGWALSVMSVTPAVMGLVGQSIEAAVGSVLWWLVGFPLGDCLLLLALFPTDARAIRVVCATLVVALTGFWALHLSAALAGERISILTSIPQAALFFAAAAALAPTLRCRGDRAMQPRPALRRLWTVTRLFFLGFGVFFAGITAYVQGGNSNHWPFAALSAAFLLCAALATPRNRGRIHRRLGRLGGRGTEAEEAAAIAALVGGRALPTPRSNAPRSSSAACPPAGCSPRTSPTTWLRHPQGRRCTRARSRRRWGK
jgi:hypothetical protein